MNKSLAVVIGVVAALLVPSQASASISCDSLSGSGADANNPYEIGSQEEFAALDSSVCGTGKYFKLVSDIEVSPGWPKVDFNGYLDGGFNYIRGLDVPVFDVLAGEVKNLVVISNDVRSTDSYSGGLASSYGSGGLTIDKLRFKAGTVTANIGSGCLLGAYALADLTVTNSYIECDVEAGYVGALVGYMGAFGYPMYDATVNNVAVRGSFDGGVSGSLFGLSLLFNNSISIDGVYAETTLISDDMAGGLIGSIGGADGRFYGSGSDPGPITVNVSNAQINSVISGDSSIPSHYGAMIGYIDADSDENPADGFDETTTLNATKSVIRVDFQDRSGAALSASLGVAPSDTGAQSCLFYAVDSDSSEFYTSGYTPRSLSQLADADAVSCLGVDDGYNSSSGTGDWFQKTGVNSDYVTIEFAYGDGYVGFEHSYPSAVLDVPAENSFAILTNGFWNFFPEYSVSPALPSGLTLDSGTGYITGTPEYGFNATDFVVTRTSELGFGSKSFALTLSHEKSKQAVAPTPYRGPLITKVGDGRRDSVYYPGETISVYGKRLQETQKVSFSSSEATLLTVEDDYLELALPENIRAGNHDLYLESSLGNLTHLDAIVISDYGEMSAWTKRISDTEAKVYVKYPTVGEKLTISHQTGGNGSYETVYVKTTSSETMEGLRVVAGVGSYIVRTIDLVDINRIRVEIGDERPVQVRYNR